MFVGWLYVTVISGSITSKLDDIPSKLHVVRARSQREGALGTTLGTLQGCNFLTASALPPEAPTAI